MIPDLSVAWVIFFVLLLTVIVDRLLLRPVLRVLEGEALWPPPIWIMRQAGRYLPEYRAVRAEASRVSPAGRASCVDSRFVL